MDGVQAVRFYALDQAIAEYEAAGGFAARTAEYRRRASIVRAGFERLGLSMLIDPPHRANSLTAMRLPGGVGYRDLHDKLKERGYVIYAAVGYLADDYFRVATMGELATPELTELEAALKESLTALKRGVPARVDAPARPRERRSTKGDTP